MTSFVEFMLYGVGYKDVVNSADMRCLQDPDACMGHGSQHMPVQQLPVEGEEGEPGEGRHPSCNVDLA